MARKWYCRGVRIKAECGHEIIVPTGFYRLSAGRAACIVGEKVRRGVFCPECKAHCQPVEYLGTCRL